MLEFKAAFIRVIQKVSFPRSIKRKKTLLSRKIYYENRVSVSQLSPGVTEQEFIQVEVTGSNIRTVGWKAMDGSYHL